MKDKTPTTRGEGCSPPADRAAALALLSSWCNDDETEQKQTWLKLKKALDEDRESDRQFFKE